MLDIFMQGSFGALLNILSIRSSGTQLRAQYRRIAGEEDNLTTSNYKIKMPKLIFQVLIVCSGWAFQILEGSPTAGVDLQENQIVSQHVTPEQLRSLQVIIIIIIVLIMIMSNIRFIHICISIS